MARAVSSDSRQSRGHPFGAQQRLRGPAAPLHPRLNSEGRFKSACQPGPSASRPCRQGGALHAALTRPVRGQPASSAATPAAARDGLVSPSAALGVWSGPSCARPFCPPVGRGASLSALPLVELRSADPPVVLFRSYLTSPEDSPTTLLVGWYSPPTPLGLPGAELPGPPG
jgi:hypothetical protein